MTKEEIVLETVEYYTQNSRSVGCNGGCEYLNDKGAMCAVGRCMEVDSLNSAHDCELNNPDGVTIERLLYLLELESIDELLKPDYHGHDYTFWSTLQCLHDTPSFWIEGKGLSGNGKEFIKNNFKITVE